MTIRDHLKRRFGYGLIAALIGLVIVAVVASITDDFTWSPIVQAGLATCLAIMFFATARVRCPKCHGDLWGISRSVMAPEFAKDRVKFCPHCGVSFDEELDRAQK
jgi:hypothetical protein